MKKLNKFYVVILSFLFVFLIGFVSFKFGYEKMHEWDNTYIKVTTTYDKKQLCHVGDEYFFAKSNGVYAYGNSEPVIQADKPLICAENDILYVYSDDIITGYTVDLKKTEEFKPVGDLMAFSVANEKIITFDTDRNLHIYNKNDMSEYALPQDGIKLDDKTLTYFEFDNMKIFEYVPDEVNHDTSDGEFIFENGEKIFEYRTRYAHSVPYVNEKYAIVSNRTYVQESLMKFNYKSEELEHLTLNHYDHKPDYYIYGSDSIISVLQATNMTPHMEDIEKDNLKVHGSDIIEFVNADNMKIEKIFETKEKERVLFADKDTAITFYKGEYITYSLDSWKKISSQKATEIQKENEYCFQTCGDYIFVYNYGDIINRIPIS